jgi:hypothetical protein
MKGSVIRKLKNMTELDINTRTRTMLILSLRCRGERGFALLEQCWHACSTSPPAPQNGPDRPRYLCPDSIRAQNVHLKSLRTPY